MYGNAAWALLFTISVFVGGMYGPLVRLSYVNGRVQYDTSQVVFLNELVKLIISLLMLAKTSAISGFSLLEGLPYCVPGLCYFLVNNLSFLVLTELDPATFSVLSNTKILTTTILYVLVMKRYPNLLQLIALALLTIASFTHSYGTAVVRETNKTTPSTSGQMQMRASLYGISLVLVSVSLSSFAAVYTEFTVKRNFSVSLHKQNIYLYVTGIFYNSMAMLWRTATSPQPSQEWSWLAGFNLYTWMIIINTAVQGLSISVIMKYSNNITRLVITCSSLMVSASMSIILFDLIITPYFIVSLFLVILALVIYNIASLPSTPIAAKVIV